MYLRYDNAYVLLEYIVHIEGREGGFQIPVPSLKFGPNPSSQANFFQNPSYQKFRVFGVYNGVILH